MSGIDIHKGFSHFFITVKTWKACLTRDVRTVIAALWHVVLSEMYIRQGLVSLFSLMLGEKYLHFQNCSNAKRGTNFTHNFPGL